MAMSLGQATAAAGLPLLETGILLLCGVFLAPRGALPRERRVLLGRAVVFLFLPALAFHGAVLAGSHASSVTLLLVLANTCVSTGLGAGLGAIAARMLGLAPSGRHGRLLVLFCAFGSAGMPALNGTNTLCAAAVSQAEACVATAVGYGGLSLAVTLLLALPFLGWALNPAHGCLPLVSSGGAACCPPPKAKAVAGGGSATAKLAPLSKTVGGAAPAAALEQQQQQQRGAVVAVREPPLVGPWTSELEAFSQFSVPTSSSSTSSTSACSSSPFIAPSELDTLAWLQETNGACQVLQLLQQQQQEQHPQQQQQQQQRVVGDCTPPTPSSNAAIDELPVKNLRIRTGHDLGQQPSCDGLESGKPHAEVKALLLPDSPRSLLDLQASNGSGCQLSMSSYSLSSDGGEEEEGGARLQRADSVQSLVNFFIGSAVDEILFDQQLDALHGSPLTSTSLPLPAPESPPPAWEQPCAIHAASVPALTTNSHLNDVCDTIIIEVAAGDAGAQGGSGWAAQDFQQQQQQEEEAVVGIATRCAPTPFAASSPVPASEWQQVEGGQQQEAAAACTEDNANSGACTTTTSSSTYYGQEEQQQQQGLKSRLSLRPGGKGSGAAAAAASSSSSFSTGSPACCPGSVLLPPHHRQAANPSCSSTSPTACSPKAKSKAMVVVGEQASFQLCATYPTAAALAIGLVVGSLLPTMHGFQAVPSAFATMLCTLLTISGQLVLPACALLLGASVQAGGRSGGRAVAALTPLSVPAAAVVVRMLVLPLAGYAVVAAMHRMELMGHAPSPLVLILLLQQYSSPGCMLLVAAAALLPSHRREGCVATMLMWQLAAYFAAAPLFTLAHAATAQQWAVSGLH